MEREFYFDDEFFSDEVSEDEARACPRYMRALMDRDTVCMYVSDLFSGEPDAVDISDSEEKERKINTDFIYFTLFPCFVRSVGANPSGWLTRDAFAKRVFYRLKKLSDIDILGQKVQYRLTELVDNLYGATDLEVAKENLRELLILVDREFDFGFIGEEELQFYSISYLHTTKVLGFIGILNPEEFRYSYGQCSFYMKKVPQPNLWDIKKFLEEQVRFVVSNFVKSFEISKNDPSDRRWVDLYNECERVLDVVNLLIVRIPTISVKNDKKEIWTLNTNDYFGKTLRETIVSRVKILPDGQRDEFLEFFLPEEFQRIIDQRKVYRPWKKA